MKLVFFKCLITLCLFFYFSKLAGQDTSIIRTVAFPHNIRSIAMTLALSNEEQDIDGLLVALDAKKAFDSVEHSYIKECLRKFGLGNFCKIFDILYSDLKSDIIVNGRIVEGFKIKRGVKQGDALSCILFIMCMEPLLANIEANTNINGIQSAVVRNELPKIYAYADDVNALIVNSGRSLQELFNEYN